MNDETEPASEQRERFTVAEIYFAIPGDINTLTGGYGYDRRLIAELHAAGHKVVHLCLSPKFPQPDAQALTEAAALFAALPDNSLIIVDGLAYGVMESIVRQHQERLIIVALCHHPLMLEAGLSPAQAEKLFNSERFALHAAKAVIVTSNTTGRLLTEKFSVASDKITVAPPGTDRQIFTRSQTHSPRLLTLATLTRRKAHDVLIDALMKNQQLEWSARFVGGMNFDPEWVALLKNKVADYGLGHRITFVGETSDSISEFCAADIFVLPSLFEGYGMAFAEALSFGLPIVATRTGAVPDLVPESAGILVPPADVDALAQALHRVLTDAPLRRQLKAGAEAAAQKLPSWKDTFNRVDALISRLPTNT